MRNALIMATLFLCSCGGGGSPLPTPAPALVVAQATATPNATPTTKATTAPTSTPTPAPSSAPTTAPTAVPLSQRSIAGAPLAATIAQLQSRMRVQSHTAAQGISASGIPVLVESSGLAAQWAGDQAVWASNVAVPGQDIPETALTVTPSGNLALNNPAPAALSCLGQVSAMCAIHPMAFEFGTSSANGKPVGKQTLTLAFADGTTGTTTDNVYDGWALQCNTGFVYQSGVPVATATRNASDVYADCVAGNVVFPQGGTLAFNPVQDQFGRYETIMPTITSGILISSFIANVPMATIATGQVFGIATKDGGFAKVYMSGGAVVQPASPPGLISVEGLSLHANPDSTYSF